MGEDLSNEMKHVEAVLYTTGKYMAIDEIAEACGLGSVGVVKDAIKNLQDQYEKSEGALEIQEHEGRFKLNTKKKYGFIASKLSGEAEFDGPTIKTLAVIAYKSPVIQSEIIGVRGNKAYDHISQLKEDGLISSERHGRSRMLKLSNKFFEYFDVAEKEVKDKFSDVEGDVRQKVAWKMGTTPEHIEKTEIAVNEKKEKDSENGLKASSEESEEGESLVYDDNGKVIGVLGD
ncbi:SMC-Scp complex subunit ScpB [Candidatus Woesearchaeota archaeon]|jgi:segregation and condensation protein B|nr:SMC-Scp complex subunit ScpB [Candidatus Woesearchaeota archaeon]